MKALERSPKMGFAHPQAVGGAGSWAKPEEDEDSDDDKIVEV